MRTKLRLLCIGVPAVVLLIAAFTADTATGQTADFDETPLPMTLDELEDEIERREADLGRYSERLTALEQENSTVGQQLEARGEELQRQEHQVRRRIVTLCRLSRGGYIQLIRGAQTWAEIVRRAQLARLVIDDDVEALRLHQQSVTELERQRVELSRRVTEQRELHERIVRYRRELESERRRRLAARRRLSQPQSVPATAPRGDYDEGLPPLEL